MRNTANDKWDWVIFFAIGCVGLVASIASRRSMFARRSAAMRAWAAANGFEIVADRKARWSRVRRLWNGTTDFHQDVRDLLVRTKEGEIHRCFLRLGRSRLSLEPEGPCPVRAVWAEEGPRDPADFPAPAKSHPLWDDSVDA